jgi:ankyrin repeat protein
VRLLLEKGADVEAKDNSGWTALHYAARRGHEAVVRLLLEKGVDVEAKTSNGWMALRGAANSGHCGNSSGSGKSARDHSVQQKSTSIWTGN